MLIAADPLARVEVALPAGQTVERVMRRAPAAPFSEAAVAFVGELGRRLRGDRRARAFPELVALGFWARGSGVRAMAEQFRAAYPGTARRPRGLAFHVAPANVDTIFVYSMLLSVLAGNANIVRVSSRGGDQSSLLMTMLGEALAVADPAVAERVAVVRYEHDRAITDALSRACDLRVAWGGDATVGLIRESPLKPTGIELVFPNKYSFAVMDARAWLAEADQAGVARRFVNDALWFGQAACSSPRLLAWLGDAAEAEAASATFWPLLDRAAADAGFEGEDAAAVAKLIAEQELAIAGGATILPTPSNRARVVRRAGLAGFGEPTGAGDGFFAEYRLDGLDALAPLARPDWQTIGSYGVDAGRWAAFLDRHQPPGIDRIVPLGQALDFNRIWDGVDLIAAMTRITALPG